MSEPLPEIPQVMVWRELPDRSTPANAETLNRWSGDLRAVAEAAEGMAVAAQVAADQAEAPTEAMVTNILDDPSSTPRSALNGIYVAASIIRPGVNGVVGDGVTDDTAAIQAIIDALPLNTADTGVLSPKGFANGGLVAVARGRYKVSSTINLRRGVHLVGASRESSQFVSHCTGSVFRYQDAGRYVQDEILVENFSIWQDASVTPTSGAGIEVAFGSASVLSTNIIARNVLIEGTYDGFLLGAGVWSSFDNCNATKAVRHGFHIRFTEGVTSVSTTSTTFKNCYASINGQNGYHVVGGAYISWEGSASDSNGGYGYYLDGGKGMSLFGCGAEENTLAAVHLRNTKGTTVNLHVVYNVGTGARHGVELFQASDTVILGGQYDSSTSTGYAIKLAATGGRCTVVGANFDGNFASAISDTSFQFLHLDGPKGLVGSAHNWSLGTDSPDQAVVFQVAGSADGDATTGAKASVTFTGAGATRNVAAHVQAITAATAVTYPLVLGVFVPNASKGAGSTINRTAGVYVAEQTQGVAANAALMVDAGQGTVPAGQWAIYSGSTRDSVFHGPLRLGGTAGPTVRSGAGSPEGVVTAAVGSLYTRTDGTAGATLYVKESGTGNTGWVAK